MATIPESSFDPPVSMQQSRGTTMAARIDKWIYVFMAALFVLTALVGFVPSSIGKTMAVNAGMRPPFPIILHIHAVLMGSWLLLLLTQATLMATGRRAHHMKLGVTGLLLMPAMIIAGIVLVPVMVGQLFDTLKDPALPPAIRAQLEDTSIFALNIVLVQLRIALLFPLLVAVALCVRKTDADTHKRLMILATVVPLGAAIDRISFLPSTMPADPIAPDLYSLVLIAPMLLWDVLRRRALPKAYLIWFAVWAPTGLIVQQLWNTPWWQASARNLFNLS
jgi:hypothetical protein